MFVKFVREDGIEMFELVKSDFCNKLEFDNPWGTFYADDGLIGMTFTVVSYEEYSNWVFDKNREKK